MLAQHTTSYTLTLKEKSSYGKSSYGIKLFHIISQLNGRISDAVLGSIPQDVKGKNTHLGIPISQTLLECVFILTMPLFFPVVINTLKFDFFFKMVLIAQFNS